MGSEASIHATEVVKHEAAANGEVFADVHLRLTDIVRVDRWFVRFPQDGVQKTESQEKQINYGLNRIRLALQVLTRWHDVLKQLDQLTYH
jgi:hypothetical protein